jgi:hypothetical protein
MESHNLPLEGLARTLVAQEREAQLNAAEPYPFILSAPSCAAIEHEPGDP